MTETTLDAPPVVADPRRWGALVVALLAVFIDLLDAVVVQVALPSIQRDLHVPGAVLEWSVAGYIMAFALMLITGGRLGDMYGRKRMLMLGLAGFIVASAVSGAAQSGGTLIAARAVQGATAALMVPQVLSFVQVAFGEAERPKAMGLYGMAYTLGGISAPLVGGLVVQANLLGLEWRPIFYINVPLGLLGLLGIATLMRESRAPARLRLDIGGVVIASLGVAALLYPLIEGRAMGWPAWTFVSMAASLLIFGAFALYERGRQPAARLVDLHLLRQRSVFGGLLVSLVFFVGAGYSFVLTLHLQEGLGYGPLATGLTLFPFAIGTAGGAVASMSLMPRLGRTIVTAGSLVMALGVGGQAATVHWMGAGLSGWQLAPALLVTGMGLSMVATTLVTIVIAGIPEGQAGAASGLINTSFQIGMAIGVALIGTMFFALLGSGIGFVASTERSLAVVASLVLVSGLVSFVLPAGASTGHER